MEKYLDRIRDPRFHDCIVSPDEAATWIESGMTLGLSGFTRAGDVKAVPVALVEKVKHDPSFKVNVYTGASLGSDVDKLFAEAGIIGKRLPFQADATMRKGINQGNFLFWKRLRLRRMVT
jgi:succinyl-CoA:acetate CoA-transferase